MSAAVAAATGNGTSSIDAESNALSQIANAAPSEIRDDFKTFAAAFSTYAGALKKAGYKPGSTPSAAQIASIAAAAQQFGSPKLKAAETHLTAWAHKNCAGLTPNG
jgi:hypothetical protein